MSATHGALIVEAKVSPHPNADRLRLAAVGGFQVVVGLDTADGDLVVFFSSDLALSPEYAAANDCVAYKDEETGENKGGYFPKNLKVRPQRFRGERSDGYIAPLSSLAFTGADLSTLKVGDLFTDLNDVPVCAKFVSKATKQFQGTPKSRKEHPDFAKHHDTEQFGYYYDQIPAGALVTVSHKVHGTSARTGLVLEQVDVKRTVLDRLLRRTRTKAEFVYLTGTRNVVLDGSPSAKGYYSDESFRTRAADLFKDGLLRGEIVYYEIVGYTGPGSPIMSPFDLTSSKDYKKRFGAGDFSYGCPDGTFDIYAYRITHQTTDANGFVHAHDLSFPQVEARCKALGIKSVPVVLRMVSTSEVEELRTYVDVIIEGLDAGGDPLNQAQPAEGVVVRVEAADRTYALKSKTTSFKIAEGIIKEQDDSVDLEEVS